MLISGLQLQGTQVLSLHLGAPIARISELVIDPNDLSIIAFRLAGPQVGGDNGDILETRSIREFSEIGMIIDSIDELVHRSDVIHLDEIMNLNFHLLDLKVLTKTGKKLGKVEDFTIDPASFRIMQVIVKRPTFKSFVDPELTIGRSQISEVTDREIIIKSKSEKALKKSNAEEFVPNFVNPFRKEPNFAPIRNQTPDEEDTA
ncbi:MAG: PRC-barrel domain-containing protein [Candidatus Saccharibacteria bacterium]|nr:PRC-barrel domain-containing protein [Candidatus Saccharibacteria bacterium]